MDSENDSLSNIITVADFYQIVIFNEIFDLKFLSINDVDFVKPRSLV